MDIQKNLKQAAENIIYKALEARSNDKLIIITDKNTQKIAKIIAQTAKKLLETKTLVIEDFTPRPARKIPKKLLDEIDKFKPTLSIYAADGKEGELPLFRRPLVEDILTGKYSCLHAHMISITQEIMLEGMLTDPDLLYKFTIKLYKILKSISEIHVKDRFGTDLKVKLSKKMRWVPSHGKLRRSQYWQNLPGSEVFTTPDKVNGKIFAFILGDYFITRKILSKPVEFTIKNSRVQDIKTADKNLQSELERYLSADKNANRVGEFAFGTNIGIKNIIGNLLQDEKFPGIHLAFGFPYPKETGADWISANHLDIIPLEPTVELDGKRILDKGKYLISI